MDVDGIQFNAMEFNGVLFNLLDKVLKIKFQDCINFEKTTFKIKSIF
jgi:hypothetical protein